MREIKFRAWVPDADEMHSVEAISYHGGEIEQVSFGEACDWDEKDGGSGFDRDGKSCVLMQYTGLKDKNGEDVYEGDIVQSKMHEPQNMEVKFIEGGFCCDWGDKNYPIDINHFYPSNGCCIEVIGNIYQNPELIKNNYGTDRKEPA